MSRFSNPGAAKNGMGFFIGAKFEIAVPVNRFRFKQT